MSRSLSKACRAGVFAQACLFETHRFLESCRADYAAGRGFPRSARALQEALEQCPEAAPPVVVV